MKEKRGGEKLKEKKFWFRILNEATNINSFRFLYEATGSTTFFKKIRSGSSVIVLKLFLIK